MEPVRDVRVTLVDLLDRILDKGLLINADLIISVAGVPLIGVKLNAAIASVETMLKYGVMADWSTLKELSDTLTEKQRLKLMDGERLISKFYGSVYVETGLYPNWRPGWFYITERRVLLIRKEPFEVLAEIHYGQVEKISAQGVDGGAGSLHLHLKTGELFQFRLSEASRMRTAIERAMGKVDEPASVQIYN